MLSSEPSVVWLLDAHDLHDITHPRTNVGRLYRTTQRRNTILHEFVAIGCHFSCQQNPYDCPMCTVHNICKRLLQLSRV